MALIKKKKALGKKTTKAGRPDKRAGAPRRLAAIREEKKNALRDKMKGNMYLTQIERVAQEYDAIIVAMDAVMVRRSRLTKSNKEGLMFCKIQAEGLKFRLEALKAKTELNFKRLKFVLPELKAIELSDPAGNNPFGSLACALKEAMLNTEEDE